MPPHDFLGLNPIVVLHINLSNSINIDGKIKITVNMLIIAPRDINIQRDEIISIFEYNPTPTVAAKNPKALTIIDFIDVDSEM